MLLVVCPGDTLGVEKVRQGRDIGRNVMEVVCRGELAWGRLPGCISLTIVHSIVVTADRSAVVGLRGVANAIVVD